MHGTMEPMPIRRSISGQKQSLTGQLLPIAKPFWMPITQQEIMHLALPRYSTVWLAVSGVPIQHGPLTAAIPVLRLEVFQI